MAALVDPVRYNSLPSLDEVNETRQTMALDHVINGPIRDVFLKHAAHVAFCLSLQHRHHFVGADEAVVKVGDTAHVMNGQVMKDMASFGNKLIPTTWMADNDEVLPMELAVVPAGTNMSTPTPAFVLDFLSILALNGCEGLFSIDHLAKDPWVEMTIGDASVVVPSNDSNDYDQDVFILVAFAFDEENPQFKVHGKCSKAQNKHSSKTK